MTKAHDGVIRDQLRKGESMDINYIRGILISEACRGNAI